MTSAERVQLDAFARVDGAMLSLLWIGSFACYILGLSNDGLGLAAIMLAVASPFFVARRLRHFRDYAREGTISFLRGWAYVVMVFFYAGVLFALAQYAYFAYLDHGYLASVITRVAQTAEFNEMMKQYGTQGTFQQMLVEFQHVRPIDFALQGLSTNIMVGIMLGLPIAALLRTKPGRAKQ